MPARSVSLERGTGFGTLEAAYATEAFSARLAIWVSMAGGCVLAAIGQKPNNMIPVARSGPMRNPVNTPNMNSRMFHRKEPAVKVNLA